MEAAEGPLRGMCAVGRFLSSSGVEGAGLGVCDLERAWKSRRLLGGSAEMEWWSKHGSLRKSPRRMRPVLPGSAIEIRSVACVVRVRMRVRVRVQVSHRDQIRRLRDGGGESRLKAGGAGEGEGGGWG